MKKLLVFLVFMALVGVGAVYVFDRRTQATVQPPRRERAERAEIIEKVSAQGKLLPMNLSYVTTDVPGRIAEILPVVEIGGEVKAGQPLIRLDTVLAQARLDEANAAVLAAEASKRQAEAKQETANAGVGQAKANQDLKEKKYQQAVAKKETISKSVLDEAEADFNASKETVKHAEAAVKEAEAAILTAEANIKTAQAKVKGAKEQLDMLTINAPVSGTIIEKRVHGNQLISPQATPILLVIAPDLSKMELLAQVSESDIAKVRSGMKATFTVDAYTDDTQFEGEVTQIAFVPTAAPSRIGEGVGGVYYTVTIAVKNDARGSKPLKSGLSANVDLVIKKSPNSLCVPNAALGFKPNNETDEEREQVRSREPQGWKPIWIWKDDARKLLFVQTGANDGSRTEIVKVEGGNLEEGSEVVVENATPAEGGGLFSKQFKF